MNIEKRKLRTFKNKLAAVKRFKNGNKSKIK